MFSFFFDTRYDAGTISEIELTGLWVTMHTQDEIGSTCVGCQKCIKSKATFKIFVKTIDPGIYSLHQNVVVKRTTLNKVWSAGFVFGTPLLFAFATLLGWNYISFQPVGSPLSIGAMMAAIIIGFIAVFQGDGFFRNKFSAHFSTIVASDNFRNTHG